MNQLTIQVSYGCGTIMRLVPEKYELLMFLCVFVIIIIVVVYSTQFDDGNVYFFYFSAHYEDTRMYRFLLSCKN